jgi:curved DNA-binding protein CbpA
MNLFLDLIDSGKIRSKEELRSLYRQFIKKYHPDSRPALPPAGARERAVDFDELKKDYRAAAARLAELAPATPATSLDPFRYDAEAFMGELRDLVARGLPVSQKALRKNKAYAASVDYVSKGIGHLYGSAYSFRELDVQAKFLYGRIPRIYYYFLQVFWSCFDCASGHEEAAIIARRHLGCISHYLGEMGFSSLDGFLGDLIELALRLAREAPGAHPGGEH